MSSRAGFQLLRARVLPLNSFTHVHQSEEEPYKRITTSPEDRNFLSPHLTSCLKRFGDYAVDTAKPPEPWLDDQTPPRKGAARTPDQAAFAFIREA